MSPAINGLIMREEAPLNAGTPLAQLAHFITPLDSFFKRNHAPIPAVDPQQFRLIVDGLVKQPLSLSLDDLRRFPRHHVVATLQCAGNRRTEMIAHAPVQGEIPWDADAISTATWSGISLAALLAAAEPMTMGKEQHVAFVGLDRVERDGETFGYGGSIDLQKALSDDVLVADEMNGTVLPPEHGFPLRIVVPGYIGARSVKWVTRLTVQDRPSDNYFQTHAYRLFPPDAHRETADWSQARMLDVLNVNSLIVSPQDGEVLPAGSVTFRGYAIGGAGHEVARVSISLDDGTTWQDARLEDRTERWAWRFWRYDTSLGAGRYRIAVKAEDASGTVQSGDISTLWNFPGYMNNVWHRITLTVG